MMQKSKSNSAELSKELFWGLIFEYPLNKTFRLVSEWAGEAPQHEQVESSLLLGSIWESPFHHIDFDFGIRIKLNETSPDWMFTSGLTFAFDLK